MKVAVTFVLAMSALAAQEPRFDVRSPLVLVPVVVSDAKGRSVAGLEERDFRVLDNGSAQKIIVDSIDTGVAPIALVIAVESSGISAAVIEKVRKIGSMIQPQRTLRRLAAFVFPGAIAAYLILSLLEAAGPRVVLLDTALAAASCCVVLVVSAGLTGPPGRLLASKPLTYVGRITYGLYVYHPFIHLAVITMAIPLGLKCEHCWARESILALLLTVLVASASWRWFEGPLNDLKRHF